MGSPKATVNLISFIAKYLYLMDIDTDFMSRSQRKLVVCAEIHR